MNKRLIEKEVEKHRNAALNAWNDFQLMPTTAAKNKAERHLEIADALELALYYNAETEKFNEVENSMRRIKTIAETGVNNQYTDSKVYLHRILSEVHKCQK